MPACLLAAAAAATAAAALAGASAFRALGPLTNFVASAAAPPIVIAVQTALVGRWASTSALAAFAGGYPDCLLVGRAAASQLPKPNTAPAPLWHGTGTHTASPLLCHAAVGTCVAFVARAANFLVDGVSSRVGKTVGQRIWGELATHVQLSVRWSALLGAAAVPLLLALRTPLLAGLLDLAADVQQVAAGYWVVRSAAIPLQLLAMAAAGILQVGYWDMWEFGPLCGASCDSNEVCRASGCTI